MARDDPHFRLRLPADLKTAIEVAAKESGRSINSEIVVRLDQSVNGMFLDMSGEGFVAYMLRFAATQRALEELYFDCRDIDIEGFIIAQREAGKDLTRTQAIRQILREYLSEKGFVTSPKKVRANDGRAEELGEK
ncbi:Arc family DNA-binding protein [Mesorhizobium microcysteis]|uniref:Arc family DNA-binding protein n=1 Tax=Neoaquamicrobium microcysteis TaxID=2682781 RepID=A0A5D4GW91_9HYPH|nr:Arc family DNA-binding protein [Mesorhizobium microcysteis]TYR32079.1 Arc family DNA-binding protein [Mesorhizobium microcysteis]